MEIKKLGLVIADVEEFRPVKEYVLANGGDESTIGTMPLCKFMYEGIEICAINCGVGKVNAALGAIMMINSEHPDHVINFGLSGAVSGVHRHEIVVGSRFYEHDFDMTVLGYAPGEKPGGRRVWMPDDELCEMFRASGIEKQGVFVSGDCFISGGERRDYVVKNFGANCCDMESSVVAAACEEYGIPYASVRYMSDSADDVAGTTYREINETQDQSMLKVVLDALKTLK